MRTQRQEAESKTFSIWRLCLLISAERLLTTSVGHSSACVAELFHRILCFAKVQWQIVLLKFAFIAALKLGRFSIHTDFLLNYFLEFSRKTAVMQLISQRWIQVPPKPWFPFWMKNGVSWLCWFAIATKLLWITKLCLWSFAVFPKPTQMSNVCFIPLRREEDMWSPEMYKSRGKPNFWQSAWKSVKWTMNILPCVFEFSANKYKPSLWTGENGTCTTNQVASLPSLLCPTSSFSWGFGTRTCWYGTFVNLWTKTTPGEPACQKGNLPSFLRVRPLGDDNSRSEIVTLFFFFFLLRLYLRYFYRKGKNLGVLGCLFAPSSRPRGPFANFVHVFWSAIPFHGLTSFLCGK